MSIKNRQIDIQTQKGIRKELVAGRFPELTAVQNYVTRYFLGKPAGLPRFTPNMFEENSVSNPDTYNTMLHDIYEDLYVSFKEVDHQHKKLLAQEELNEKEKQRILLFYKEIEQKAKRIEQLLRFRQAHTVFTENFFNFTQIEFDPQEDKNIAGTNAFIDLRHHRATLHESQIGREKLFLDTEGTKTEIKFYTDYKEQKTLGVMRNAIKDTANEAWRMVVNNDEPNTTQLGYVIHLEKEQKLSMVRMSVQSKSPTRVKLLLSEDGKEWTEDEEYTITGEAQWTFPPKKVNHVQFLLTKDNHDQIKGTSYEYWFGIQNIRLYRNSFMDKAMMTTKSFSVNEDWIDEIMLIADEERHPSTMIRYFIGEEREDTPIEWKEIIPYETFNMNMLDYNVQEYTPRTAGYETPISHPSFPSKTFYELGALDYDAIPERMELKQGERMWKVNHYPQDVDPYYYIDENGNRVPTGYKPSLADWVGDVRSVTRFLHIDDTLTYDWIPLRNETYTAFEMNFENTNIVSWASKEIRFKGDMDYQLYVDNMVLQPTATNTIPDPMFPNEVIHIHTYSFYFEPGKHKMKLTAHSKYDGKISLNFDFSDTNIKDVFGDDRALRYVGWNELVRYTSSREIHKFTILNGKIVVPYYPNEMDYKHDWELDPTLFYGVDYRARYRYIDERRDKIHLRLMAIFERDPDMRELSPFLHEYSLVVQ